MIEEDFTPEELQDAIFYSRLLYLKQLKLLGHQVDYREIERLEAEVYPQLQRASTESEGLLSQRDIDEMQLMFALVESEPDHRGMPIKIGLHRLHNTVLRMSPDPNHQRPHFHIEYKQEYRASYALDTLERLDGDLPRRYEKPMLEWAVKHARSLKLTWERLQAGDDVQGLVLEAEES